MDADRYVVNDSAEICTRTTHFNQLGQLSGSLGSVDGCDESGILCLSELVRPRVAGRGHNPQKIFRRLTNDVVGLWVPSSRTIRSQEEFVSDEWVT